MIYINWKGPQGRETIDQIDPADHEGLILPARKEARRLIAEYALAGMPGAYMSRRCCKGWN